MNGMGSFANGCADWHRIENAKKFNRPVNSFVPIPSDLLISMGQAELAIYCDKLQQIITNTPGVDLSMLK